MNCRSLPFARCTSIALLLTVVFASTALAQRPKPVRMSGKLKEVVADNELKMTGPMDQEVTVKFKAGSGVIEGTAEPAYLIPGMAVEFVADVNGGGFIQEPVKEIKVCTITDQDKETFSLNDPTKASNKGKDAINKYLIRGTIKANKKGSFIVNAPGKVVRGELAPDVKVNVSITDVKLAQPGDAVAFQGADRDGVYMAYKLSIKMAKPLEPTATGPARKKTASK